MVRADKAFQLSPNTPPAAQSRFGNRFPRIADAPAKSGFYPPMIDRPEPPLPPAHHRRITRSTISRSGNHVLPGPQLPSIGWISGENPDEIVDQLQDRGHRIGTVELGKLNRSNAAKELLNQPARSLSTLFTAAIDCIAMRNLDPLRASWRGLSVANILRTTRVARVHAQDSSTSATVAMYAARQLRVPFSFSGVFASQPPRDLSIKLRRAASVACRSYEQREEYLSIYPAADRYHVASNLLRLEMCLSSPAV